MPYAVLEKEIKSLHEAQRNTVAMFVRFLLAQGERGVSLSVDGEGSRSRYSPGARDCMKKVPLFGALKGKIKFIAPDFDEPLADFAEYM